MRVILNFLQKFTEIFASQGAPPVSTTSVVNDNGGSFAAGVTTLMANLPLVSTTPAATFAAVTAGVV